MTNLGREVRGMVICPHHPIRLAATLVFCHHSAILLYYGRR